MALQNLNPNWQHFVEQGRALVHAGEVKASKFAAFVRDALGTQVTNEELNQLLTDIITKADSELAEIATEQSDAAGEVSAAMKSKHGKRTGR